MLGDFNDSCEADGMVEMENDIKAEGCLLKDTLMEIIIITTHISHSPQSHIICLLCKQNIYTTITIYTYNHKGVTELYSMNSIYFIQHSIYIISFTDFILK
jgi:hypothetical protein